MYLNVGAQGGNVFSLLYNDLFPSAYLFPFFHSSLLHSGGLYVEDTLTVPLIENTAIVQNKAVDGGGGGVMWIATPPTEIGNVRIHNNQAQYGNNIASGIVALLTSVQGAIMTSNFLPIVPEIKVSIVDHYGNLVKRRNQATTVVATVFSEYCMYRTNDCPTSSLYDAVPECHNCVGIAQSVFGKPAQEIPGLAGTVNFTGLGIRAWPGKLSTNTALSFCTLER